MSLMKFYWKLQNTRVTAFTISELLRENQQEGKITPPLSTQIRVKVISFSITGTQRKGFWKGNGKTPLDILFSNFL